MKEYIEREALIQRLENSPLFTNFGGDGFFICNGVIDIIKKQLSVKSATDVVEVRHGKWLPYPSDAYMKCSICGMEYHKSRMPDVVGYCPNPNCGAKMDGGNK